MLLSLALLELERDTKPELSMGDVMDSSNLSTVNAQDTILSDLTAVNKTSPANQRFMILV